MARTEGLQPTELELEILKVLWDESPLLVREVRARLEERASRTLAHSSVITMLNIMHRKGFLKRRKEGKSFRFWPAQQKQRTVGRMTADLMSKLFNGSPAALVVNLLEHAEVDAEELAEIRRIVARKSKETQP